MKPLRATTLGAGGPMVTLLGLLAGVLSSALGMGGGQLLTLGLAAWAGPWEALTWTGPALLTGNLHRVWLYRSQVDVRRVVRFAAGAVPGALLGGLLAAQIPTRWLTVGMAVLAVFALARQAYGGGRLPARTLTPGGFLVGGVAATAGGGGVVAAPLWRGTGVEGDAYIACMAAGAGSVHIARMVGYGLSVGVEGAEVWTGLALGASVLVGNLIGHRLRRVLPGSWRSPLEVGAVITAAMVAVLAAAYA